MTTVADHNNDAEVLRDLIKSLREDQHHLAWRINFQQELLDDRKFQRMLDVEREKIAAAFDYIAHLERSRAKAPQMVNELNTLSLLKDEEILEAERKLEVLRGATRVPRVGAKSSSKDDKQLSASEKYQAFLKLIPEHVQKTLGSEQLMKLYESAK
jgi:hypothetical protein